MPTAKNGFHILNLRPKRYTFKKKKKSFFFNANLLEKFHLFLVHLNLWSHFSPPDIMATSRVRFRSPIVF